jgi:hypothetical protein
VTSPLLAFRLAKPIELPDEDVLVGAYDPVTQTSTWEGGTPALALSCTGGGFRQCNAYGTYCNTWGSGSRRCDS